MDAQVKSIRRRMNRLRVLRVLAHIPPFCVFFIGPYIDLKTQLEDESDQRRRVIHDLEHEARRRAWVEGGKVGYPPLPRMYQDRRMI